MVIPYKDPEKQKAAARRHYLANKTEYVERAKKHKRRNLAGGRHIIWEHLLSNPCVDCKETDPLVLQFDHRGDKEFAIGNFSQRNFSLMRLKKEIAKCDIRCANCHQRKTALERGWWADKLERRTQS